MDITVASILFSVAWVVVLWYEGLYRLRARWTLLERTERPCQGRLARRRDHPLRLFVLKHDDVSRLFLLVLFTVQPVVTFAGRAILRAAFGYLRARGRNAHFMLVVGTGHLAQEFADRVEGRAALGIQVIGHLSVPGEPPNGVTRPILGALDDIKLMFHAQIVDEVAVCLAPASTGFLDPVARLAADEGKTVRIPVDPLDGALPNGREEEFEGMVVRSLVHDQQREFGLLVKRIIDIVGSAVGLVVLSPLLLATAIVIRLRDGSPILFRQTRTGLHGRPFTILKFRTMVPDAEARFPQVAHLNERNGVTFKASGDPRITALGLTLRRTSIDELPQLWNVLRGEMSLVGPRPPLPDEVGHYDVWHRRRLSMKPGVTGLWQVEARRDPDFDRWVQRDLTYIDGWSLLLDLRILARTVPAVMRRDGR